jgi:hypothetical protein
MFTPSTVSGKRELSIIRYRTPSGASVNVSVHQGLKPATLTNSLQSDPGTPMDMIVHETLRGLIDDVNRLQDRCDVLEAERADLLSTMAELRKRVEGADVANNHLSKRARNVSGYASSESSSEGWC